MGPLHVHERELSDKIADWAEIETTYMQCVIDLQEEHDGICLVAHVDGKAAGFIFGYAEEPDNSRIEQYTGPEFYVSDGYIEVPFRRLGLYRAMNTELERIYRDRGVKRFSRFTHVNNHRMRQFLEGEGYVATRVLYEKWLD